MSDETKNECPSCGEETTDESTGPINISITGGNGTPILGYSGFVDLLACLNCGTVFIKRDRARHFRVTQAETRARLKADYEREAREFWEQVRERHFRRTDTEPRE